MNLRIICYLVVFVLSNPIFSQDSLRTSDFVKFSLPFKIENGTLIGQGADSLLKKVTESQFFLLGEQHYVSEISVLTNILLPVLSQNNYRHFAVEVGSNSATKLESFSSEGESLYLFNSKYYDLCGEIPIPFFDGVEDGVFLKTALNNKFSIWGIDQEYLSAQFFLCDEIMKLSDHRKELEHKYKKAQSYMIKEFKKFWDVDDYKIYRNYLESAEIADFFNNTDSNNLTVQGIISGLKKSWEIYAYYDNKQYRENWLLRIKNMQSQFSNYYKNACKTDTLPKVFVKMGAVHLAHGINSYGYFDIGNMINEIANFNGTNVTSVMCAPRFYQEQGELIDDLKVDDILYPILKNASSSTWTIFDNINFINFCYQNKMKIPNDLLTELNKYDFILIPPAVHEMEMNYKE